MLILALSVCLAQDPETCKVVQLPFFAEHVPASECTRYGEPEMKKWLARHPEWAFKGAACRAFTTPDQAA